MPEANADTPGGSRSLAGGPIENGKAQVPAGVNDEAMAESPQAVSRAKAMDAILEYRKSAPPISDDEIHRIRQELRE
ncbi:MAG: hypothetical protein KF886_02875 [Candidatus Hydrogenedentes bacterium]|nr:hypothetical protein [Candidatus Hydrogenedentota bacterium]